MVKNFSGVFVGARDPATPMLDPSLTVRCCQTNIVKCTNLLTYQKCTPCVSEYNYLLEFKFCVQI